MLKWFAHVEKIREKGMTEKKDKSELVVERLRERLKEEGMIKSEYRLLAPIRHDFPQCTSSSLFAGGVTSRRHLRWQYLKAIQTIIISSRRL